MARRPIRFEDMLRMARAGSPRISPDGRQVVFTATRPEREANRNQTHLYRVPLDGGGPEQLTRRGGANTDPTFSPDGQWIAFTSDRADEVNQIWVMPADGGEARQVTRLRLGAKRPVWFPDGKRLLVTSPSYPGLATEELIIKREDERKESGATHRVIDSLMFRHWDRWTEGKVDHLFVIDVETGAGRDLTPGPYPAPPLSLTGVPDYAVSPDGKEVCFVSLRDDRQALSTNTNLWTVSSEGGEPKRVSHWNGCNAFPVYSPDGERIAYCAMRRAGYEADKRELLILDRATGDVREVAEGFDLSVGPPVWSPDGKRLYFGAEAKARRHLFTVEAKGGEPEALTSADGVDGSPVVSPDGKVLVFTRETMTGPPEVFRASSKGGKERPLTALNEAVLAELDMAEGTEFWFEGAQEARIHGILLKPPGFDPKKKYPVVFLIHGGPQSAFTYDFHERWNTQLFAAPGHVVVMMNPRGSTGYGQEFTDAIRGQWGSACYEDLTRGFDHVLATFEFTDPERTAAAGASFGGFMVNWIAGKTDRFRCLVSHDGIVNTEMMDYATDELWFTEWEFEGAPWENPEAYLRFSPHLHVKDMKTPMLVIQGEQDFRCVVTEGLTLFTALQRRGVPSRLLYFPDEGHWVLKPRNREVWYETVLGWIGKYLSA